MARMRTVDGSSQEAFPVPGRRSGGVSLRPEDGTWKKIIENCGPFGVYGDQVYLVRTTLDSDGVVAIEVQEQDLEEEAAADEHEAPLALGEPIVSRTFARRSQIRGMPRSL